MTYDQLINGDDAYVKRIERAYIQKHGHPPNITDQAHNIWRLLEEGWTIEDVLRDITGDAAAPQPSPTPTSPSVPPAGVDLTSFPRRGATHASGLLDTRWDYEGFAAMLGSIFGHRSWTQVNVLSALWADTAPFMQHPFRQQPDGLWDLRDWNPLFFDRLRRYVETMNAHGVYVLLCFLELYSWSYRKTTAHDKAMSPVCHNMNGINWLSTDRASDDRVLAMLPDEWLLELIAKCLDCLRGLAFGIKPFNEGPEKDVHLDIAAFVKARAPEVRVQVNRNEDTPGQYRNMKVGTSPVDMIAFHGWKNIGFLTKDYPDHYKNDKGTIITPTLPRTFAQFFKNEAWDGRTLNHDFRRVVINSDGSRASADPLNAYNYPDLKKVMAFGAKHNCTLEHQTEVKLALGAQLAMVNQPFLKEIAAL